MSFKRLTILAGIEVFLICLGHLNFMGCANPDQKMERQEDRVVQMLDERRYGDVIEFIEGTMPASEQERFTPYLAEAYLGKSGFIPLSFADNVLGDQSMTDQPQVQKLIPNCLAGAILSTKSLPIRCVLWRLFLHLPDPDQADFARARSLLRSHFSDPKQTQPGYNVLCGIVETASLLASLKKSLLLYQDLNIESVTDAQIQAVFDQMAITAEFSIESLKRARSIDHFHISKNLTGLEQQSFFLKNGIGLSYLEQTGIPLAIQIAEAKNDNLETIAGKILILQQLDGLVEKLGGR